MYKNRDTVDGLDFYKLSWQKQEVGKNINGSILILVLSQ